MWAVKRLQRERDIYREGERQRREKQREREGGGKERGGEEEMVVSNSDSSVTTYTLVHTCNCLVQPIYT